MGCVDYFGRAVIATEARISDIGLRGGWRGKPVATASGREIDVTCGAGSHI